MWGKDGNINLLWNANYFKILGTFYQAEVERFIVQVAQFMILILQDYIAKDRGRSGRDSGGRAHLRLINAVGFPRVVLFYSLMIH